MKELITPPLEKTISNTMLKTNPRSYPSIQKASLHLCILVLASFGLSFCSSSGDGEISVNASISQVDTTGSVARATAQIEFTGVQVQAYGFLLYSGELSSSGSLSQALSNVTADSINSINLAENVIHIRSSNLSGGTYSADLDGVVIQTDYNIHAYFLYAKSRGPGGYVLSFDSTFSSPRGSVTLDPFARNHITDITVTTANATGTVANDGGDTDIVYGHVWSTRPILDNIVLSQTASKTAMMTPLPMNGAYTSQLAGLTAGAPYYTRAYVTNDAGTVFSAEQSFRTDIDSDNDGILDSVDTDDDDDDIPDTQDIDDDNDGLIEIHNLEMLDRMRHNLAGTSYRSAEDGAHNTTGAPTAATSNCSTGSDVDNDTSTGLTYLCGYELARSLDFSKADSYAAGSVDACLQPRTVAECTAEATGDLVAPSLGQNTGWTHIGTHITPFAAIFDGNGYRISNLYINRASRSYAGLFGYSAGALRNIGLEQTYVSGFYNAGGLVGNATGATITSSYVTGSVSGHTDIGGLVGDATGTTITSSYATGSVSGTGDSVGGLVGVLRYSGTTITSSYATGSVSGGKLTGGLVGHAMSGTIASSYATGSVSGTGSFVGGLAGAVGVGSGVASGMITSSYATGSVNGTRATGGLVGWLLGTITSSYATGSVSGTGVTGGLVGLLYSGATITSSYATGSVSGTYDAVGGLVGLQDSGATITSSYATGSVSGTGSFVGGLVGYKDRGTITSSYAIGFVSGTRYIGGLVGYGYQGAVVSSYAAGSVSESSFHRGGLTGKKRNGPELTVTLTLSCGAHIAAGNSAALALLRMATTSTSVDDTSSDGYVCNKSGNDNTNGGMVAVFAAWDNQYYRRTGPGTDTSPYVYTLVTEGASGCTNSTGATACDGANYPSRGDNDVALWNFGNDNDLPVFNPNPSLSAEARSGFLGL